MCCAEYVEKPSCAKIAAYFDDKLQCFVHGHQLCAVKMRIRKATLLLIAEEKSRVTQSQKINERIQFILAFPDQGEISHIKNCTIVNSDLNSAFVILENCSLFDHRLGELLLK